MMGGTRDCRGWMEAAGWRCKAEAEARHDGRGTRRQPQGQRIPCKCSSRCLTGGHGTYKALGPPDPRLGVRFASGAGQGNAKLN